MWILNLGKPVNIPVLNEAQAIELGANLLGEAIIFVIAAAILISEYARFIDFNVFLCTSFKIRIPGLQPRMQQKRLLEDKNLMIYEMT